jgi:hypothetical protein
MHVIGGNMATQNLHPGFTALFAHDFADPFGNLTAENFATILGDPHNMEMDRKNGVGTMAIITHMP